MNDEVQVKTVQFLLLTMVNQLVNIKRKRHSLKKQFSPHSFTPFENAREKFMGIA